MSFVRRLATLGLALAALCSLSAQDMVPALSVALPNQSLSVETGSLTVDLRGFFYVPGVKGKVVQFTTDLGRFNVELYGDDAPLSVANFLSYVSDGSYNGTIIHRSTPLSQDNSNPPKYFNGIVQGGGYTYSIPINVVAKKNAIPLEYKLPNVRGTIAMARTSDVNSATSEWFFNQDDNTSVLGASNGGGYAVFGRVLGNGMSVIDAIYGLKTYSAANTPFTNLPLQNYSNPDGKTDIKLANFVDVSNVSVIPMYPVAGGGTAVINFNATSASPTVATVVLSGSNLTITPVGPGTSLITVSALDVNGNGLAGSFLATVQSFMPPSITTQPQGCTVAIGTTTVLSVEATGTAITYQWSKDGNLLTGANSSKLVLTTAQAGDAGSYTVAVNGPKNTSATSNPAAINVAASTNPGRIVNLSIRAGSGSGNRVLIMGFVTGGDGTNGTIPLLIRGVGPTIQSQLSDALPDPVIQIIPPDGTVVASNDNWGGDAAIKAVAAATGAFPLASETSKDAALLSSLPGGPYTVIVRDKTGAVGSVLAEIYDATEGAYDVTKPRLVNVSARGYVDASNVLIAGFVVSGDTAKTMLIRGIGPNEAFATAVGSEALADPVLTLYKTVDGISSPLLTADNWGGDPQIRSVGDRVGASSLTNVTSKDAAVLVTLNPGVYSAVAYGANKSSGVMLMEVYDVP